MIEVEDLSKTETHELLERIGYGHLGCSVNDLPYVVPVHYAFDGTNVYIYTTDGKKSAIIRENPYVCLQVEDVKDNQHWESVIVDGRAIWVRDKGERERAMKMIVAVNPTLTPAVSIHWLDNWVKENVEIIFKVEPIDISGRRAVTRTTGQAPLVPGERTVQ